MLLTVSPPRSAFSDSRRRFSPSGSRGNSRSRAAEIDGGGQRRGNRHALAGVHRFDSSPPEPAGGTILRLRPTCTGRAGSRSRNACINCDSNIFCDGCGEPAARRAPSLFVAGRERLRGRSICSRGRQWLAGCGLWRAASEGRRAKRDSESAAAACRARRPLAGDSSVAAFELARARPSRSNGKIVVIGAAGLAAAPAVEFDRAPGISAVRETVPPDGGRCCRRDQRRPALLRPERGDLFGTGVPIRMRFVVVEAPGS